MAHILIVDDESSIRESLRGILEDEGYKTSVSPSGEDCLELLRKSGFDLILLDVWLTGIDGLEVLEKIREMEDPPEVIMISGHGTIETAVRATKLGAYDFAEKPLSLEKTLILVKNAIEARRLRHENLDLRKQLQIEERDRGRQRSHESAAPADCADGADQRTRADLRRIGHRQRTGCACHSHAEPAQG
jgi:two-component system, NtrC family, nitrogen regulation response regulator NtrX